MALGKFQVLVLVLVILALATAVAGLVVASLSYIRMPAEPDDENFHFLVSNKSKTRWTNNIDIPSNLPEHIRVKYGIEYHNFGNHMLRAKQDGESKVTVWPGGDFVWRGQTCIMLGQGTALFAIQNGLNGALGPLFDVDNTAFWSGKLAFADEERSFGLVVVPAAGSLQVTNTKTSTWFWTPMAKTITVQAEETSSAPSCTYR